MKQEKQLEKIQSTVKEKVEITKFHEIELEKIFDAIIAAGSLRLQIGSFFGTINLGVLSYGLSSQHAGIIIFAAALFGLMLMVDSRIIKQIIIYLYFPLTGKRRKTVMV